MCGIAGFCFTADSCLNARALARTLLESIEERGREATGYAYLDADGVIVSNNAPLSAKEFVVSRREFRMDAAARVMVGHTRLATKGTIKNPLNNHPVLHYGDGGHQIAAVHNGGVWNDDEVFDRFKLNRYGQVDSEIIPAMIAKFGSESYPEIFAELTGGIATGWLDERTPGTLHMVRAWDSPMVLASIDVIDKLGLKIKGVIFASTVRALTAALGTLGLDWSMEGIRQWEIAEGEYLSATDGEWDGLVYPFVLPDVVSRWGSGWRGRNRSTQGYNNVSNGYTDDDFEGWGYPFSNSWGENTNSWGENTLKCSDPGNPECVCRFCLEAMADEVSASVSGTGYPESGIGSGKVESGKPSTYQSEPDGSLTPMALDDSIGESSDREAAVKDALRAQSEDIDHDEEVAGWWRDTVRMGVIADLGDRLKDGGYVPDSADMKLLASTTMEEQQRLGITPAMAAEWNSDFLWHMEVCDGDTCRFNNPVCPASLDGETDPTALAHAAAVWGFAAIAE